MASYHLHVAVVSRGKGQSAIAKAAYNAREALCDERTGELKDYSRRAGVLFTGIFAPKDAPEWARDRGALWNAAEQAEEGHTRSAQARLARSIDVALPHELTDEQRRQLVTDFVREQFQRRGMVADVAIHAPDEKGDSRNHHAHILLTVREIGPGGFGKKVREWNDRAEVEKWREAWERTTNRYLERHGHEDRVDRRTLAAQGIEREPTKHRGPTIDGMERRGIVTERGEVARRVEGHEAAAAVGEAFRLSDSGPAFVAALRDQVETLLSDPALSSAGRAELQEIAIEIGDVESATREPVSVERDVDTAAVTAAAIGTAGRALDLAAETAGRAIESLADMFGASEPTREDIAARVEAREQAAERREVDWQRYRADAAYRDTVEKQDREQREREQQRQFYDRQKRGDRDR